MQPSRRFATLVLALGTIVLLCAIALGQLLGYHVLSQTTELHPVVVPTVLVTPEPMATTGGPYGPAWKRSQPLAAAPDPNFPDPRIPPVPLPTPRRTPKPKPTSTSPPTPTPNPNIPIWDQSPFPPPMPVTPSPSASPSGQPTAGASPAVVSTGATSPPRW
jgi:hypothetical protein